MAKPDTHSDSIQDDFQNLRQHLTSVQLATVDSAGQPEASYAPCVWVDQTCYLYLSSLARHTRNLLVNPAVSLMIIEAEDAAPNPFARRRIVLYGEVKVIERETDEFNRIMTEFKTRYGNFIDVIEPLQDFHLFQINPDRGRYIAGFAQAYELSGPGLSQIQHINPQKN